jgi:hypothetical protein
MRVLPPVEEEIRRIVRDARAKSPLIRAAGLTRFSHQYVSKISDKVARQGLIEADRTKLEERLQFTRRELPPHARAAHEDGLVERRIWRQTASNRDVNEAAKNIVIMDLAILQAEAAAGMYKKPLEVLAREVRYEPFPIEVRAVVIAAWQRGGLLSSATVKATAPQTNQGASEPHAVIRPAILTPNPGSNLNAD